MLFSGRQTKRIQHRQRTALQILRIPVGRQIHPGHCRRAMHGLQQDKDVAAAGAGLSVSTERRFGVGKSLRLATGPVQLLAHT